MRDNVDLPIEHLPTFVTIIEEGSFEGAAKRLHITPSAVSQRMRAMEERVGTVLLRRTRPIEVTEAGATVLRAARQINQIASDAAIELGTGSGSALVPIVVNADSLSTWFVPALARATRETGAFFEVLRADETESTAKLRSGEVMAALTATAGAVPGCTSTRVGTDRYRAVASPTFVVEHFACGVTAASLATAPLVEFDRHDVFQRRYIRRVTRASIDPPRHLIPSSADFVRAIELGMGWGMVPELQCAEPLSTGALVDLGAGSQISLPLYWQRWNLRSPLLDAVSTIIAEEAHAALA